jgi:hypothetical protein
MESERRKLIPLWVSFSSRVPIPVQVSVAAIVGTYRLMVGVLFYDRRHVVTLLSEALGISFIRAAGVLLSGEINTVRSHIEFASFEALEDSTLSGWVADHTVVEQVQALSRAVQSYGSVLILTTSFASHYYGLVCPEIRNSGVSNIVVLQPSVALQPLQAIDFYGRLERAGSGSIKTIPADSPYSLMKAIKAMRRGGTGVARFDSLPTETANFLLTSMLGVEVAFPVSLLRMAQLAKVPILPLFVFRRAGRFVTRFGQPVPVHPDASSEELSSVAASLSRQVEREMLARPGEYTAWHGFYEKVRTAREIRELLGSQAAQRLQER